jgi:hypothetical protein
VPGTGLSGSLITWSPAWYLYGSAAAIQCIRSASPQSSDIGGVHRHFAFVPISDIGHGNRRGRQIKKPTIGLGPPGWSQQMPRVVNECTCAPNGAWRGRSDRARDP